VLGGEESGEVKVVGCWLLVVGCKCVEDVDGAVALGVQAGLVGEEGDVVEVGEGGEVGGF